MVQRSVPKVTLYTFATSPYGLKVQAYLAYKRISYDIVYVDPFHPRRTLPVGRIVPPASAISLFTSPGATYGLC